MNAIIGLGNPEVKYLKTRHNIGFMVVDKILEKRGVKLNSKFNGYFGKDGDILFLLPTTYMNLSGRAVSEMMNFYKLGPKDIIVIFDDVSLNLGALRFRNEGSDGGHNGIKSIISSIGSPEFPRLKVGIGPQPQGMPLEHFVLQDFRSDEEEKLKKIIDLSALAIEDYLIKDFSSIQNTYNKVHFN